MDSPPLLMSCACTQGQLESGPFRAWNARLKGRTDHLHRKIWEWCYIARGLEERGMLQTGRRGVGFAVGQEPLTALFAARGCDIVATDLGAAEAHKQGWVDTQQHAASIEHLNRGGICPAEAFAERVRFRSVDMNRLPGDLREFDFAWSSCSIEHLGSIDAGIRFMLNMTRCLRVGGVAIHTTEYNVSSDTDTWTSGHDVIFRKSDLLKMQRRLEALGHRVEPFDFRTGDGPADLHVDEAPYAQETHLKLRLGPYVSTSFGIIVTVGEHRGWLRRLTGR